MANTNDSSLTTPIPAATTSTSFEATTLDSKRRKMRGDIKYLHQFVHSEDMKTTAIVFVSRCSSSNDSNKPGIVRKTSSSSKETNIDKNNIVSNNSKAGASSTLSNCNSSSTPKPGTSKEIVNGSGDDIKGKISNEVHDTAEDFPVKTVSTTNQLDIDDSDFQYDSSDEDEADEEERSWIDPEFDEVLEAGVLIDKNQPSSHLAYANKHYYCKNRSLGLSSGDSCNYDCEICSNELIDETAKLVATELQQQQDKERRESNNEGRNLSPFLIELLSYDGLLKHALTVKNLLQHHEIKKGFVAIATPQHIYLPSIMIGIMQQGCGFYQLDYRKPVCDSYLGRTIIQFNWIIADLKWVQSSEIEDELVICHHKFNILNNTYFLIKLAEMPRDRVRLINFPRFKYATAFRTSGTSSMIRRVILVPHKAICTNVKEFTNKIFNVQSNDVIVGVSPPTFDPSIIDLLVTLASGSRIIYVDETIKLVPNDFLYVFKNLKITILQITPSFLLRFDKELLKRTIFHTNSSLRILALGGEKCPPKETLRLLIPEERRNSFNLYNLYELTELSCWASVEPISLNNTDTDEIPIGSPLKYINFAVFRLPIPTDGLASPCPNQKLNSNTGELFIGCRKRRKCTVFSEKFGTIIQPVVMDPERLDPNYRYLQTGDFVRVATDSKSKKTEMYFVNRTDKIKRNGVRVDLEDIERVAMKLGLFSSALCFEYKRKVVLILTVFDKISGTKELDDLMNKLYTHLKSTVSFEFHPERIVIVNKDAPLNLSMKLDYKTICEQLNPLFHDSTNRSMTKSLTIDEVKFKQIFLTLWEYNTLSSKKISDDDNFLYCGGNSVSATRFIEEFFFKVQKFGSELHISNEKRLFLELLTKPLKEVMKSFYQIVKQSSFPCQISIIDGHPSTAASAATAANKGEEYVEAPWETGTNDESDSISKKRQDHLVIKLPPQEYHRVQISVGLCVDATPVVASHPTFSQICIVGSHSEAAYAFSMLEGLEPFRSIVGKTSKSLVWKRWFPNRIECSIVIHPTRYLGYLGCHDGKLYMLSTVTGQTEWSVNCGAPIRCSPALTPNGDIVVVLTSFTIFAIDALAGTILWTQVWQGFIITKSPAVSDKFVYFATKNTGLACLCLKTGTVLWRTEHNLICTSPLLISAKGDIKQNLVIFGNQKGRVFALDQATGDQVWKFRSVNHGYKDPVNNLSHHDCSLSGGDSVSRGIIFTTSSGFLRVLAPATGILKYENKTDERLCSMPLVVHVCDEPAATAKNIMCSAFFNTKKGIMYWVPLVPNKTPPIKPIKIYEFGADDAESFSSPALVPHHNIIAVGSRDNKAYFVEFQKPYKATATSSTS